MRLGRVIGKVWATAKEPSLKGVRLYIMQPLDYGQRPEGSPIIAVDGVGAGEGEIVFWVGGADATLVFPGRTVPSDASIVGIVDQVNLSARAVPEKTS
jgi:ethanolamine utilization protein EutN